MLRRAIRVGLAGMGLLVAVAAPLGGWWVASESPDVWPVRNTLQYALVTRWWGLVGAPRGATGGLEHSGTVLDAEGVPVAGARVLFTRWDGRAYAARTGSDGSYRLASLPREELTAVAGAPGVGEAVRRVSVGGRAPRIIDFRLAPPVGLASGRSTLFEPEVTAQGPVAVSSAAPVPGRALRWDLSFPARQSVKRGRILLYLPPNSNAQTARTPLLMTAYPGPAEEWEGASIPLAEAGYAVVAYAPPYGFTPEAAVTELRLLLEAARQGRLPGVDGTRVAVLAGSYSGLHALRVLQEEHGSPALKAAVLMGAPSDLFDMRRRLEDGSFVPPFGLDQALVALGFPDREALRYWRYSGAYHVRRGMPPTLLVHSRQDDVVPYQQSELLARTLGEEGVMHELHVLDGGSHYLLSAEREARGIYELTLRFLGEHLR
ncbi:MAG TPA: carboxypeptidase regulatory-like domain-containing protein [Chloroflexota bacterium]|nr:carboxypeptidase regulatory-like domain-containing protein [Chloroflexota bacterium]